MSRTLDLRPIIGLVTNFKVKDGDDPHFGSIHHFCEELHHGIEAIGGLFYVFSFSDFPNKGYCFIDGRWQADELPLPDVIYNRIHSRRLEYDHEYKQFRDQLARLNIPIFNDRFLSKWEVHEHLIHENHLHSFIPETKIFTKENLKGFADQFESIFIKPVHGSQGRNIFKLIKQGNLFTLQSSEKIKDDLHQLTIEDAYHYLKPLVNNRIYIIQQGIPLLTYDSRGMDFRALCHKNYQNNWGVTSVVARISAKDEFVSNIARGGEVLPPLQAITNVMTYEEAASVLSFMKKFAAEVSEAIDTKSSGITGELGIDIGIDIEGKPWLIEVNSKPSKNFEDGRMKIRPSAKAIIQFCTMLALNTLNEKEA
nr:YheC/YheD family protein [Neobacillus sp. Marseille-Q6967]